MNKKKLYVFASLCVAMALGFSGNKLRAESNFDSSENLSKTTKAEAKHLTDGQKFIMGLRKSMQMTDDQTRRMIQISKKSEKRLKELRKKIAANYIKLQGLVNTNADDKKLRAAIRRLEKSKLSFRAEKDKHSKRMFNELTPMQHAKLLLITGAKQEKD